MGLASTGGCQSEPVIFNSCSFGLRSKYMEESALLCGLGAQIPTCLTWTFSCLCVPRVRAHYPRPIEDHGPIPTAPVASQPQICGRFSEGTVCSRPQTPKPLPGEVLL